jgi:hypothetical protein
MFWGKKGSDRKELDKKLAKLRADTDALDVGPDVKIVEEIEPTRCRFRDEEVGVKDAPAFAKAIGAYRGKPENCTALVQLGYSNADKFRSEASGERWINVLTLVKEAGGPQYLQNCFFFIRTHSPTVPASGREAANALTDEIFRLSDEQVKRRTGEK